MDRTEKLSKKLYKDIVKHGDKSLEKFLKKGADPELILNYWSYSYDAIDPNIILELLGKVENLDQSEKYFYSATKIFLQYKTVDEIVEFSKRYPSTLNVAMNEYRDAVVYNRDMVLMRKYSDIIKSCIEAGVKVGTDSLATLVYVCGMIPSGDENYPDRAELMENSYSLCEAICKTDTKVATETDKVGVLKQLISPVVENDDTCIEYIYNICKLLMDKGADLHGDANKVNNVLDTSICRKDFSNKLRNKLEDYYQTVYLKKGGEKQQKEKLKQKGSALVEQIISQKDQKLTIDQKGC